MTQTAEPLDGSHLITATLVTYEDRDDECTLHPVDPRDGKRTTEWITAKQGAYIEVASWR